MKRMLSLLKIISFKYENVLYNVDFQLYKRNSMNGIMKTICISF